MTNCVIIIVSQVFVDNDGIGVGYSSSIGTYNYLLDELPYCEVEDELR